MSYLSNIATEMYTVNHIGTYVLHVQINWVENTQDVWDGDQIGVLEMKRTTM